MFFTSNNKAFTLIELMVAIALVALLATIVVPNFFRSNLGYERRNFIAELNSLVRYGQQHAIITGRIQQIFVEVGKSIELRSATGKKDVKGQDEYKLAQRQYVNTKIAIPSSIDIKNFVIEGFDAMDEYAQRKTGNVWFFIVPEGLTQEVIINFLDTNDKMYNGKPRPVGLVLNPFTAQFKEYDTFQK